MKKLGLVIAMSLCAQNERDRDLNPGWAPVERLAAGLLYAGVGYSCITYIDLINHKNCPSPRPIYSLLMFISTLTFLENRYPDSLGRLSGLRNFATMLLATEELLS